MLELIPRHCGVYSGMGLDLRCRSDRNASLVSLHQDPSLTKVPHVYTTVVAILRSTIPIGMCALGFYNIFVEEASRRPSMVVSIVQLLLLRDRRWGRDLTCQAAGNFACL